MIARYRLRPYVKKELVAARQAQQENHVQLAELRYERALILSTFAPRQRVGIYIRMAWFWTRQRQLNKTREALTQARKHLFITHHASF